MAEWFVLAAGVAGIALVNWYFLFAGRRTPGVAAVADGDVASVTITVDGGYAPAAVRVRAGEPVRLVFDRRDRGACSEEVVFPDFGVRRFLPTGQKTVVEITPPRAGRYEYACGMGMLHGAVIAED